MPSPLTFSVARASRLTEALLWLGLAACLTFWLLRLLDAPAPLAASAPTMALTAPPAPKPGSLFGPAPSEQTLQLNLKVLGVVAGVAGGGSAIISVDNRPAEIFLVGDIVTDQAQLARVAPTAIELSQGGQNVSYPVPQLPDPGALVIPAGSTQ
ncbi:type II secretion system protein N [Parvibium lacunae]|nr:type II secretion system protein N [Parvibium lacunae]